MHVAILVSIGHHILVGEVIDAFLRNALFLIFYIVICGTHGNSLLVIILIFELRGLIPLLVGVYT
jgi:hypothetical protein